LKAKENSSASFLGFGILTTVLGLPGSTPSARTITSLSSSFSRSGRILATTRTDIVTTGSEQQKEKSDAKKRTHATTHKGNEIPRLLERDLKRLGRC